VVIDYPWEFPVGGDRNIPDMDTAGLYPGKDRRIYINAIHWRGTMKKIGATLLVIGIIGLIYFGYEALQESEQFEILGADIAVSTGDWTPVIASGIIVLAGLLMVVARRGK
jgi:NO-binding membrane sensor protein with MHYT domain